MANLITDFCKIEVKNPIGVTACDFGGSERLLRRCAEQGIGWIIDYCQGCGWCVGHCKPNAIRCIHAETGEVVWDGFGAIADWV